MSIETEQSAVMRKKFVLAGEDLDYLKKSDSSGRSAVDVCVQHLGDKHGFIWTTASDFECELDAHNIPKMTGVFTAETTQVPAWSKADDWIAGQGLSLTGDARKAVVAAYNAGNEDGVLAGIAMPDLGMLIHAAPSPRPLGARQQVDYIYKWANQAQVLALELHRLLFPNVECAYQGETSWCNKSECPKHGKFGYNEDDILAEVKRLKAEQA